MIKKDIYVELIKIFKKRSFQIIGLLLIIVTILMTIYGKESDGSDIYYQKLSESEYSKLGFNDYDRYLKKYEELEKLSSNEILKEEYILKNDINIDYSIKSKLDVSNTILLFLSIYIVILSCSSFGYEYDKNTIKLIMLNKPSRVKVIVSKLISLLIVSALLSLLIYIVNLVTVLIINGFDALETIDIIALKGNIVEKPMLLVHTCEYLELCIPHFLLISLSLLAGLLFKGSTLSSSFSIFLLLCSSLITKLFLNFNIKIIEYSFLPYLDFMIFTDKFNLIMYNIENDINLGISNGIIIVVIYSAIMLLITSLVFNRREYK